MHIKFIIHYAWLTFYQPSLRNYDGCVFFDNDSIPFSLQNYMQWYKNIMNPFKKIIRDLLLIVLWSHDFPPCLKTIFNAHTCPFLIHFLSYFETNINSWETKCFYSKQLFYKGNGYFDQFWKSMYLSRVNYKTQVIFSTLLWRSMMVLIKVFSRVQENGL